MVFEIVCGGTHNKIDMKFNLRDLPLLAVSLAGFLLPALARAQVGEQGRAAEVLAKGLYCNTFDVLSGDIGLILGLLVGFVGFLILIFKQLHATGIILILAGVALTALPAFFESTFSGVSGMAAQSGIGNQTFSSQAIGRRSLKQNCDDYDAVLAFIQDGTIIGDAHSNSPSIVYDEDGNPIVFSGNGTAGDFSQFGITAEDSFYDALGKRECNSGYTCVNQSDFIGRYQLGCAALTDAGYATGGTNRNCNFNGRNGIHDRASFLASASAQEDAVRRYHGRVQGYLQNAGLWDRVGTSYNGQTVTASGLIGAAHLAGVGNLQQYFNGEPWVDGNGTSPGEYIEVLNGRDIQ